MRYIDMHCDTLMSTFFAKKPDIYSLPDSMFDFCRFRQADGMLQFTAAFFPPKDDPFLPCPFTATDEEYFTTLHTAFERTIEEHKDEIRKVDSVTALHEVETTGKMGALLTMEDGRAVEGSMEKLESFFQRDVRLISLTWNFANCFGYPNSPDPAAMNRGLTGFGKDAVVRMNELGMLVDVSHLSDGGFYDVAAVTKKPFVASHSNCRALCGHPRNMTDDMIRVLADKGGVMGMNFSPNFVDDSDTNHPVSRAKGLARHAKYAANLGGVDVVGIGTDFDGIGGDIEINDPRKMTLLWDELKKVGFTECEIDKIAYGNVARVLSDTLPEI